MVVYIKIKKDIHVIIGKISKNDKVIKFQVLLYCNNCKKKVPGGLKTSEKYYQSKEFEIELKELEKNYLCGICRDKKRLEKNHSFSHS